MIKCRPYNPKAQGKVERFHRILQRKIYYDLIKQKNTGVNWVKYLPKYMKCLNQEKREELGWKSTLEIYFGRKVNELKNEGKNHNKTIHFAKTAEPSTEGFRNQRHNTNQWRKKAREADLKMAERMMEKDTRRNVYKIYKSGDKVFVNVGSKRCRSTTKHSVLTGTILKRYKDNVTYKVQLQMPGLKQISEHKIRIEDIADHPVKE